MTYPIIDITESETEYLLSIPPSEKERAKTIKGYQWDSNRRVWVYPRTGRNFDALIGEFGNDLVKVKITKPVRVIEDQSPEGTSSVKAKLDEVTKVLDVIVKTGETSRDTQLRTLQTNLETRDQYIAELQVHIKGLQQQLEAKTNEANNLLSEFSLLKKDLETIRIAAAKQATPIKPPSEVFEEQLKCIAIELLGRNSQYAKQIEQMQIGSTFAVEAGRSLERRLRHLLNVGKETSLHDLITQARDSDILEQQDFHLAQIIRVQRNMMAHPQEGADESTFRARSLMAFFALTLLMHELDAYEKFNWANGH
jgi:hypothetical protein